MQGMSGAPGTDPRTRQGPEAAPLSLIRDAKRLADLEFTDLVIRTDDGDTIGSVKGVPGCETRLLNVTSNPALQLEIAELVSKLLDKGGRTGSLPAIRHTHNGVTYRASHAEAVTGKAWFLRRIPPVVPTFEELHVPRFISRYLLAPESNHGLVLFCGAQSSGKTTMASALIAERLNMEGGGHAVTFEAPAELPLNGQYGDFGQCIQTEIESEEDLPKWITRAHTYGAPNIIFIGEVKTGTAAVEALRVAMGSDGQLVVATIHGFSVEAALQRLLNWGREKEGENASVNLSVALAAIFRLSLDPAPEGRRRLNVPEFLVVPRDAKSGVGIRTKIREGRLNQLKEDLSRQRTNVFYYGEEYLLDFAGGNSATGGETRGADAPFAA
jgi:twitching motility protein PilT